MGDMGEYWRDIKPVLKEKHKKHVARMGNSTSKNIERLGYPFTHYPENHQFAIETEKGVIDYWGTTGTWIVRKTRKRGKGLHSLREFLKSDEV